MAGSLMSSPLPSSNAASPMMVPLSTAHPSSQVWIPTSARTALNAHHSSMNPSMARLTSSPDVSPLRQDHRTLPTLTWSALAVTPLRGRAYHRSTLRSMPSPKSLQLPPRHMQRPPLPSHQLPSKQSGRAMKIATTATTARRSVVT